MSSSSPGCNDADEMSSRGKIGTPLAHGSIIELDARLLARDCLKAIGKEMGMGPGY